MSCVIRLNVGTDESPRYLYYAGYHKGGYPPGPILVESKEDAVILESEAHASRIIGGDERLKGAQIS